VSTAASFRPSPETFDRLYRGEPTFEGAPPPAGIPWDVHQAQPRLMELEALGGFSGEVLDIGCGLGDNAFPKAMADQMPPEMLEQMREVTNRFKRIADLLDGDRVYLPFTVVHAYRVD
jgi:hypothetical protein